VIATGEPRRATSGEPPPRMRGDTIRRRPGDIGESGDALPANEDGDLPPPSPLSSVGSGFVPGPGAPPTEDEDEEETSTERPWSRLGI